uniref:Uncharacterized protein n=1 Tax=Oryza barthii TaxID=65489 RepID=A0A0D3GGI1_9ORYZ
MSPSHHHLPEPSALTAGAVTRAASTAAALDQRRVPLEPEDLLSNTCTLAAVGILCFLTASPPRFADSPSHGTPSCP